MSSTFCSPVLVSRAQAGLRPSLRSRTPPRRPVVREVSAPPALQALPREARRAGRVELLSWGSGISLSGYTDANGQETTVTRGASNEALQVDFPDGTHVAFTYDELGLVTSMTDMGPPSVVMGAWRSLRKSRPYRRENCKKEHAMPRHWKATTAS